jgi:hypothetical protein
MVGQLLKPFLNSASANLTTIIADPTTFAPRFTAGRQLTQDE